jgi:hypothetical protein
MRFIAVVSLTIAAPIPITANAAIRKSLIPKIMGWLAPSGPVVSQDPLAAAQAELLQAKNNLDNYLWPKGKFRPSKATDRIKVGDLEYKIRKGKEKVALLGNKPAAQVIVENNFDSPEIQKLRAMLISAEVELAKANDLYGKERFKVFDRKISKNQQNPELLRAVETAEQKVARIQESIQRTLNAGAKQPVHQIHEPVELWHQG